MDLKEVPRLEKIGCDSLYSRARPNGKIHPSESGTQRSQWSGDLQFMGTLRS